MTLDALEAEVASAEFGRYLSLAIAGGAAVVSADLSSWLAGPIASAMRLIGYPTAAYGVVTDDDLAAVADADLPKLIAVARLRMVEKMRPAFALYVDSRQGTDSKSLSQLRTGFDELLAEMRAMLFIDFPSLAPPQIAAGRIGIGGARRDGDEFSGRGWSRSC